MKNKSVREILFNYIVIPFLVFFVVLFSYLESHFLGNEFFYVLFMVILSFPFFIKYKLIYVIITLLLYFLLCDLSILEPFLKYYDDSMVDESSMARIFLFLSLFYFLGGVIFFYEKYELKEYLFFIFFCIFSPLVIGLFMKKNELYTFLSDFFIFILGVSFSCSLVGYFYFKIYKKMNSVVFEKFIFFGFFYFILLFAVILGKGYLY
ncbi:hypothetical protein [Avibacterium sp. 21-599]|uniref:hypothetical protein n=1 Tax=Avibacterium sp. 21-599 TaxID=2911528 RepID=UPI002247E852|nr:hypothetical protein [Avibacterium sp. 21-599]MCW9718519.1 hypothetical protein [Avibacterium sp. 21-599]